MASENDPELKKKVVNGLRFASMVAFGISTSVPEFYLAAPFGALSIRLREHANRLRDNGYVRTGVDSDSDIRFFRVKGTFWNRPFTIAV
ncbi:hypothetical protein [Haloferax larsenii]|uniref:Uncharacterized protein n=1 Tax=Haloferax larsenii TaxID=302484 RepID=A0A1H7N3Z4_HALLR|nr:hypothetical protein [Haloferax larsenii]SEL18292.1 hypothetical protein SAMN04488691_103186 [Haloferax larsenii]